MDRGEIGSRRTAGVDMSSDTCRRPAAIPRPDCPDRARVE